MDRQNRVSHLFVPQGCERIHFGRAARGQLGVNGADFLAHGAREAQRIADGSHHQVARSKEARERLRIRQVSLRPRRLIKLKLTDVAHDSDNGLPRAGVRFAPVFETFAESVFSGPEMTRHGFVDDGNLGGSLSVMRIKRAALAQRGSHGAEIIRSDLTRDCQRLISRKVWMPSAVKKEGPPGKAM